MLNNDKAEFFMLPEALDPCPEVTEIPQALSAREMLLQLKLLIKLREAFLLSSQSHPLLGSPREASRAGTSHVFVHLASFTPLHLQVD